MALPMAIVIITPDTPPTANAWTIIAGRTWSFADEADGVGPLTTIDGVNNVTSLPAEMIVGVL